MFIPIYIKHEGEKEVEEYLKAQEEMFKLTEEHDATREKLEKIKEELIDIFDRKRRLLRKYPTLQLRRTYA